MESYDAYLFLTEGFEETEAITTLDILRRGDINVISVSLTGNEYVIGSHGICVKSDELFENINQNAAKMLVLPGGPGHANYLKHKGLLSLIKKYHDDGKYLAAICAAPVVFGELNLLVGKKATCFPSFENRLHGAIITSDSVVLDGKFITSKGPGTSVVFGLKLVEILKGINVSEKIKVGLIA